MSDFRIQTYVLGEVSTNCYLRTTELMCKTSAGS